jgi:hypothetical protein
MVFLEILVALELFFGTENGFFRILLFGAFICFGICVNLEKTICDFIKDIDIPIRSPVQNIF